MAFTKGGANLSTIFEPRGTSAKRADVNYDASGVDISNAYYSLVLGGSSPAATNFKAGGTDLNALFAGIGTVSYFVAATGGTITTSGDYKIHKFTGSSTFTVTQVGDIGTVEYLVVAAGAGSGYSYLTRWGGGGGAGGMLEGYLSLTAGSKTVTIGAGGVGAVEWTTLAGNGNDSVFDSITATGGGSGGAGASGSTQDGGNGGSGGGGGAVSGDTGVGGTGIAGQGYAGGTAYAGNPGYGGGGGGASTVGANGLADGGGTGGAGKSSSISGGAVTYATGGNGSGTGEAGTANTGNGASSHNASANGEIGGSGIIIVRYKYK